MIRKVVLTKTGRGDVFYRVTLPKNLVEALGWDKTKTLWIKSTNKEIVLSKDKKTDSKVALTKALTKQAERKKHYSLHNYRKS